MSISTLSSGSLRSVAIGAAVELSCRSCGEACETDKIQQGLELLRLIERAEDVTESSDMGRDAYCVVRSAYFVERVPRGEVGWKEWNEAVHAAFLAILSPAFMEKVGTARQTLESLLKDSKSVSEDSIADALNFFLELVKGMK